jgi:RNA polymerase sigma-70 factor (ECF subfamily)
MEHDPDRDLVRDLGSADPARRRRALGELYVRHAGAVFHVAWRVSGDWTAAEDVTQEVFLGLPARVAGFRGDASLASWLYRIAINRAIDARRRDGRRPALRLGVIPDEALQGARPPLGERPTPPEPPETSPAEREVRAALAALSPKLRAIAVLRYVEGLSYEQLAEVLGCSIGTVKSRLNRAHAALLRRLGPPP